MRAIRDVLRREDGMTLIEILFASVILFFAITAVLGLIAASTRVNVQATQQTVAVNRAQSYIENVRRMSYDEIGVQGGTLPGALEANTHLVEAGFEVTITPTVEWIDDQVIEGETNYKLLRVVVSTSPAGSDGMPYTYTVETFIRESDSNRPEDAAPPEIEFVSGSPAIMEIVHGTVVGIYGHAWTPMENGLLQNMRYYCDGRALRDSALGVAEWSTEVQDATRSFGWDTTKVDEDGFPFSPDGVRQVKIQAWDNVGQTTYQIRQVVVDNYAPVAPASLTADPRTDTLVRVFWPLSLDGPTTLAADGITPIAFATDFSHGYTIHVHDESTGWSYPEVYVGNVSHYDHAALPFSRYRACVIAVSPRGFTSARRGTPRPYISRSRLTGTWTNVYTGKNDARTCATTASFSLSTPRFAYSTVTNTLYRSSSPDMSGAVAVSWASAFTGTHAYATAVGRNGVPTRYYYQVVSQIKPSGEPSYASNPVETVNSNIIGPVGTATSGTLPLVGW